MSKRTLFDKVWERHEVERRPDGSSLLAIALHLIHEVTSPQAFGMLASRGLRVRHPERTLATVDHIVPTDTRVRPLADPMAEAMLVALERNCSEHGIRFFGFDDPRQGIVHVVGPELGITQPGMTIACGDSHTSTHGAFGNIAFGIGTTQVANVLASQCLIVRKPKVRRINITGALAGGVFAKDVILAIIHRLGVSGGNGYAYEYAGEVIENLSMEGRMSICNMSIEGGATCGYCNPDGTTFDYLVGRPGVGGATNLELAWRCRDLMTDCTPEFDDELDLNGRELEPMVTWGTNPGHSVPVTQPIPADADPGAMAYMGFVPGAFMLGKPVQVVFIGSCTNGRLEDLRIAADLLRATGERVKQGVRALVVPGSQQVAKLAEREGLHEVFRRAGFEWRGAGCSMCLGMNPDQLSPGQYCASTSNRNFEGRQGRGGRTLLMSPAMAAAAAITGEVTDVRRYLDV